MRCETQKFVVFQFVGFSIGSVTSGRSKGGTEKTTRRRAGKFLSCSVGSLGKINTWVRVSALRTTTAVCETELWSSTSGKIGGGVEKLSW